MVETRKLAVILAADVVVVSRFEGADEERTLVLRRALRGDLFNLAISAASPPATTRRTRNFFSVLCSVATLAYRL
jgi:hypothetical protein